MLLAIDAGNTNIVFAVYDGDKIRAQWRAVTQVSRTADEYGVWLGQLLELEGLSFQDLDAAIIATVVPAVLFDLRDCAANISRPSRCWWAIPALDLGPQAQVDPPRDGGRRPAVQHGGGACSATRAR
jgi:type III pantothenate kinase